MQLSYKYDHVVPFLQGVIDHIEDAGGEVVYTTATGRRVRRRRSVDVVEGVYANLEEHGTVSLGEIRSSVVEVSDLFGLLMEKLIDSPKQSKKVQLKVLETEMDVVLEKVLRNIKQMEKDEAMYHEVEKHMLSVEGTHLHDLPREYER